MFIRKRILSTTTSFTNAYRKLAGMTGWFWRQVQMRLWLTLSSPVMPNGYSSKCSKPYWS